MVQLPCLNHLASLELLLLEDCYRLKEFPELPNNFSELNLELSGIEEVSDSIEHLARLGILYLSNLMAKKISSHISKLESLALLDLNYCPIVEFPETPRSLRVLQLRDTQIEEVPSCFDYQNSRMFLDLSSTNI